MSNIFNNVITPEFKNIFNQAIDSILSQNGLTIPCKFIYKTEVQNISQLCNNCYFDTISKLSSNQYNGTGPVPFQNTSCPVCLGSGYTTNLSQDNVSEEIINLGVIFDSKYFIKLDSNTVNIPDGSLQTISKIESLYKIKNASYMIIDPALQIYNDYSYEKMGDPNPCGFGSNRYLITMWKRK
jgi:hypothetical protein